MMVTQNQILNGCMILLFLISNGIQILIGVHFYLLIKQTENMTTTNDKFLKQCKLKFSHCYQLNIGVQNIPIFVDKLLQKVKIGKIPVRILKHMAGQAMLLSIFLAGYGACKGIIAGKNLSKILPYYMISLFGLYIYFSISSVVDLSGKKGILKTNLIDYLENHMSNKLLTLEQDQSIINQKNVEQEALKAFEKGKDSNSKVFVAETELKPIRTANVKNNKNFNKKKENFFDKSIEKELEELLQEFLT